MDHNVLLANTPCLPFLRKRSPDSATPDWSRTHPIAAYYSSIDPKVVKSWVGLVGWPIADALPPFERRFRQISAHSASTVTASKKYPIGTNRKSTTRFPMSHRWTVDVTPKSPKGWHETRFRCFASKIQLLSKEVCCKVSLCKNFQRQNCSYIIPLSNDP